MNTFTQFKILFLWFSALTSQIHDTLVLSTWLLHTKYWYAGLWINIVSTKNTRSMVVCTLSTVGTDTSKDTTSSTDTEAGEICACLRRSRMWSQRTSLMCVTPHRTEYSSQRCKLHLYPHEFRHAMVYVEIATRILLNNFSSSRNALSMNTIRLQSMNHTSSTSIGHICWQTRWCPINMQLSW